MHEIHAVIEDGQVANVIVLDPDSDYPRDGLVRVDQLEQRPGVGWTYDGDTFTPPGEAPPPAADPLADALEQINKATTLTALKRATATALGVVAGSEDV